MGKPCRAALVQKDSNLLLLPVLRVAFGVHTSSFHSREEVTWLAEELGNTPLYASLMSPASHIPPSIEQGWDSS